MRAVVRTADSIDCGPSTDGRSVHPRRGRPVSVLDEIIAGVLEDLAERQSRVSLD